MEIKASRSSNGKYTSQDDEYSSLVSRFVETLIRISGNSKMTTVTPWLFVGVLIISIAQILSFLPFSNAIEFINLDLTELTFYDMQKATLILLNPQYWLFAPVTIDHEITGSSSSTASLLRQRRALSLKKEDQLFPQEARHLADTTDPYSSLSGTDFGFSETTSSNDPTNSSNVNNNLSSKFIKQLACQCCLFGFFLAIGISLIYFQTTGNRALSIYNPKVPKWQKRLCGALRLTLMIYNPILVIPMIQLSLIGCEIKQFYSTEAVFQIIAVVLAFINLITSILFSFLLMCFCEQSVKLYNTDLFRFNNTWIHCISSLIKLISAILFSVDISSSSSVDNLKAAQTILVSIFTLIEFIDVFFVFSFTNIRIINTSLILSAISMCYLITFIFTDYQNIASNKQGLLLLLVFGFIISKLFLELHARKRASILFQPEEKTSHFSSKYSLLSDNEIRQKAIRISMLFSHLDDENLHKSLNQKMGMTAVLSRHQKNCDDPECFCKSFTSPLIFARLTNYFDHLNLFIQIEFLKKFIQKLSEKVLLQLRPNQKTSHQILFIQFTTLLSDLKKCARSLQLLLTFRAHAYKNEKDLKLTFPYFQKQASLSLQYLIKYRMLEMLRPCNTLQQVEVSNYATVFIENVKRKSQLRLQMITAIQAKIDFYNMILTGSYPLKTDILFQIKKTTKQFYRLQKDVLYYQALFENSREMNTVIFFFAEVWNNLYAAYAFSRQTFSYDQSYHKQKQQCIEKKVKKVSYGNDKGKIDSYSINAPYALGISKQKLSQMKNVTELIPAPIDVAHNYMVTQFFEKGDAVNFRQLGRIFYKDALGYAVPMSAFFDVDVLDFSELSFIMFLHFEKYVKKRIIYLIFNSAGKLECASPNTLSVLVSKKFPLTPFDQSKLKGCNWNQFLPNASILVTSMRQQKQTTKTALAEDLQLQNSDISENTQQLKASVRISFKEIGQQMDYFTFELFDIFTPQQTLNELNNTETVIGNGNEGLLKKSISAARSYAQNSIEQEDDEDDDDDDDDEDNDEELIDDQQLLSKSLNLQDAQPMQQNQPLSLQKQPNKIIQQIYLPNQKSGSTNDEKPIDASQVEKKEEESTGLGKETTGNRDSNKDSNKQNHDDSHSFVLEEGNTLQIKSSTSHNNMETFSKEENEVAEVRIDLRLNQASMYQTTTTKIGNFDSQKQLSQLKFEEHLASQENFSIAKFGQSEKQQQQQLNPSSMTAIMTQRTTLSHLETDREHAIIDVNSMLISPQSKISSQEPKFLEPTIVFSSTNLLTQLQTEHGAQIAQTQQQPPKKVKREKSVKRLKVDRQVIEQIADAKLQDSLGNNIQEKKAETNDPVHQLVKTVGALKRARTFHYQFKEKREKKKKLLGNNQNPGKDMNHSNSKEDLFLKHHTIKSQNIEKFSSAAAGIQALNDSSFLQRANIRNNNINKTPISNIEHLQNSILDNEKDKKNQNNFQSLQIQKHFQDRRKQIEQKYEKAESSVRRSKMDHFTQYKILCRFVDSRATPTSLLGFFYVRCFELLLLLVLIAAFLFTMSSDISTLKDNTTVLRFQSEILGPLDQFIGIVWQGFNYYLQMAYGLVGYSTFSYNIKFIVDQELYTQHQIRNFTENLYSFNSRIQEFLDAYTEVNVTDFNRHKTPMTITNRNIVFRMVGYIIQVQNYVWANLWGTINLYDQSFMFMNINFRLISETLNSVSEISFKDLQSNTSAYKQKTNAFIIAISLMILFLSIISSWFVVSYYFLKQQIQDLFIHCDRVGLEAELARSQIALQLIQKDTTIDALIGYSFTIEDKEDYLSTIEERRDDSIKQFKTQKKSNDLKLEIPSIVNRYVLLVIFIIIAAFNASCLIYVIFQNQSFASKYLSVSERYQNLADSYSLASRLSSYREAAYVMDESYFSSYLKPTDKQAIVETFDKRIVKLREFLVTEIIQVDQNHGDTNISEIQDYINFISYANSCDICSDIMHLKGYYLDICGNSQNGVLKKGLTSTLSSLINTLQVNIPFDNDRDNTGFAFALRNPPFPNGDVVQSAIYASRLLKYSSDLLYSGLKTVCDNSWNTMLIVVIIYASVITVLNLIFLGVAYINLTSDFQLVKCSLQLLPLSTICFDKAFASHLKTIYQKYNILSE